MNRSEQRATTARVGRNSAWMLLGEVLGRGLGALWQVLLARYLGILLFGELSFAMIFAAILGILADFGLSTLVTREVSRDREHPFKVLSGALIARAGLAVALGVLAVALVSLAGRPVRVIQMVAILAAGQLVQGQGELLAAAHRGREHMRAPVLLGLFSRFGLIVSGVVAMLLGAPVQIQAVLVAFWALPLLLLARTLPRRADAPGEREPPLMLLRRAAPIGLGVVLWTIYFRADLLLVSFFRGDEEAGIFAAPYRLAETALLLAGPLLVAAFPVLAGKAPEDSIFRDVFRSMLRTLVFLCVPLTLLFAFEGRELLTLVLGPAYGAGTGALLLLAGTIPISYVTGPFLMSLLARNRERAYFAIMGLGVVVNLAVAFALIPRFGARGAAMAMLVTEAAVLSMSLVLSDLNTEVRHATTLLSRAAGAAGAALGLLFLLSTAGVPFLIRAPVALLVAYPVMAVLFGLISPARILLFFGALSGRE